MNAKERVKAPRQSCCSVRACPVLYYRELGKISWYSKQGIHRTCLWSQTRKSLANPYCSATVWSFLGCSTVFWSAGVTVAIDLEQSVRSRSFWIEQHHLQVTKNITHPTGEKRKLMMHHRSLFKLFSSIILLDMYERLETNIAIHQ